MGRNTAVAAFGVLISALALSAVGVPTASAACPNEAFRTGPSALLAECRAYEQVSPVDKESGEGVAEYEALPAPSGDQIFYTASSAFAGAEGNFAGNPYLATRAAVTWANQAIGGRQLSPGETTITLFGAVSRDLGRAVVASGEALAPGAISGGSNIYVRDNRTGTYTTVVATPGLEELRGFARNGPPVKAGSTDFGEILFNLPDGIYEFREGQTRLAVPEATVVGGGERTPNVMSTDGSRFFYTHEGLLYMHRIGREPLLVSEDEEGNPIGANFVGATPSGDIAFFGPFESSLYRFEASADPGSRVTQITPPVGLEGETVRALKPVTGEDGSHVYFASPQRLTPDAEPVPAGSGYDLYAWHGEPGQPGHIRYLGKSEIGDTSPGFPRVSPNGLFFGFESNNEVTPDAIDGSAEHCPGEAVVASGHCFNVFLYSYTTDQITCVSCAGPPLGDSHLAARLNQGFVNAPTTLLDDGMILFDTPNPLVPRDINGVQDAYAWRDGEAQLVSSGTDPGPSYGISASADGSNLFFKTVQRLVGQDTDTASDLYDARIDGGLPQGGQEAAPPCTGESSCRGAIVPAAPSGSAGTETVGSVRKGSGSCPALEGRARAARKRSRALARRAGQAKGRHAKKALRESAAREAKAAKRLGRRVGNCMGGGR